MRTARPLGASLVVVLALSFAGVVPLQGPASASDAPFAVPSVPKQQPGLTMDCAPGQVDLNHATQRQLQTLPDVSGPVAQRIAASRPDDRVQDLLVVPGIGRDELVAIKASGKACSTPQTLPPSSKDACTTSSQLDVNDPASRPGLSKLFGGPTADRIVAAEPFPDLAHAKVVLAAGAGNGKVTKYAPQLCATPEPRVTGGISYSWVYTTRGGRNDYANATLVVPPNVLSDTVGSWTTISPLGSDDLDRGPKFDFKILGGSWSDETKKVFLVIPPDPFTPSDSSQWTPTIVHGDLGDQEEHFGQNLSVQDDGRWATSVTHLTPAYSLLQPTHIVSTLIGTPSKALALLSEVKTFLLGDENPAPCSPDVTARTDAVQVSADDQRLLTGLWALNRKVLAYCAQGQLTQNAVDVKFTNTSSLAYRVTSWGEPYDSGQLQPMTYKDDVPKATQFVLNQLGNKDIQHYQPLYVQGTVLTTRIPLEAPYTQYTLGYDANLTSLDFLLNEIGQVADMIGVPELLTCIVNLYNSGASGSVVLDCIHSVGELVKKDATKLELLKKAARALDVVEIGRDLVETLTALVSTLTGSDILHGGNFQISYTATAKPVIDDQGRFIPDQCWVANGATWRVDETCFNNYGSSLPPAPTCTLPDGSLNPQCAPATEPDNPPDASGCWTYDPYSGTSGAWVLNGNAGQGCLLLRNVTFCGVGSCVPWPDAANHVLKVFGGASYFVDARGGLWHLATTDAYYSCTAKFPVLNDPATSDGKWQPDNLNNLAPQGERYGC